MSHDTVLLGGIPALISEFTTTYKLNASNLNIYAPYHGSHIFSDNDVERIVQSFPPSLADASSKLTLLSHRDGKPSPSQTLHSLLTMAVKSVLRENLTSDDILESVKDVVQSQLAQPCTVTSIGTPIGSSLAAMVQDFSSGVDDVIYVDNEKIMNRMSTSQHPRQSKIAVTGFSGRFPHPKLVGTWKLMWTRHSNVKIPAQPHMAAGSTGLAYLIDRSSLYHRGKLLKWTLRKGLL